MCRAGVIVGASILLVALAIAWCARSANARAGFQPVPISVCGTVYDDHYAVDMGDRAGTVVWDPYSSISRISLERSAESPELAEPFNPIVGAGKGSFVRAAADRYRRSAALGRLTEYELQPGEPGRMEEVDCDGARAVCPSLRSRPGPGAPPCDISLADTDANSEHPIEYLTDGAFGSGVLRETLTSTRRPPPPNGLTANRCGLGSLRLDPRFEPGPQRRVASGDNSPAPGGHAGGVSLGALAPCTFLPSASWDAGYVHGFGATECGRDGALLPTLRARPEALVTGQSRW